MKTSSSSLLFASACILITACSCTTQTIDPRDRLPIGSLLDPNQPMGGPNPLSIKNKKQVGYVNPYPAGGHPHFAATPAYPVTKAYWIDKNRMNEITKNNSKLIICLPQQRARVYIKGQIAMDWPVSTGTNGHLTPTGAFRVTEKKEKHASNRYGRFISESGKTVNSNADRAHGAPEGTSFKGANMPNWHRFTWDGVGLHGGRVVPGKRLSHGCIRTPYHVAKIFFSYSQTGMPVYITRGIEDYNNGGAVNPLDVRYRPDPNNDYSDIVPTPAAAPAAIIPSMPLS